MRTPPVAVVGIVSTFVLMCVGLAAPRAQSQAEKAAPAVDFVRDVQPIFRQSCYGCHGPSQQMNGFRLDRRRDAMRGGTATQIGPGNSAGSRLYLRLVGHDFGPQMPPTGALAADQIALIKTWIDEGAIWPDAAAGDVAAAPPDPAATRLMNAIRAGDARAIRARLAAGPEAVKRAGPDGTTPLMYAALYGDAALVRDLLDKGADPNARNAEGVTALMWAPPDLAKTQLLLQRGADPNARSADARTPLLIAAGFTGSSAVLKALIDAGAELNARGASLVGPTVPLTEAAIVGDAEAFKLLVAAGADLKAAGPPAYGMALRSGCMPCAAMLESALDADGYTGVMMFGSPPFGPALGTPMFIERGASLEAKDASGRTPLMLAAASEALPVDAIKALLGRGLDVNARTPAGETALSLARRHGKTPVVDLLVSAGARDADAMPPVPTFRPATTAREAVERALPLLQQTDVAFLKKSGCVSCHNNSLTSMAVAAARPRGLRVDDHIARAQAQRTAEYLHGWRDRALQGMGIPGDADTVSYILLGLAAEQHPPDAATDAQAFFLKRAQLADGSWRILANRPPIESSHIQVTAASMRALQTYAPRARRAEFETAIDAAAGWLARATPRHTEERAFHLLGLQWSNAARNLVQAAGHALLAEQRADGGWAQLPTMESDAYATGQALSALSQAGVLSPSDAPYRRGAAFLMQTQLADGSWFVPTRAIPIQPLFDAGFPHGPHAFISAAATNWAVMALAPTATPAARSRARGR